jgi:transcriptional regulator with XRE-family HTH domain
VFLEDTHHFARLARAQREQLGLTQTELAEAIGRTQTWVSGFEKGRYVPRLDSALLVARALGLGFDCTDDRWATR